MVSRNKNKNKNSSDEYEVASLVDICYGDPNKNGKIGLHFKVGLITIIYFRFKP